MLNPPLIPSKCEHTRTSFVEIFVRQRRAVAKSKDTAVFLHLSPLSVSPHVGDAQQQGDCHRVGIVDFWPGQHDRRQRRHHGLEHYRLFVGMSVTGAGIPSGTTVVSVTANSVTLSANATATGTTLTFQGKPLVFGGSVNYTYTATAAQQAALTADATWTQNELAYRSMRRP